MNKIKLLFTAALFTANMGLATAGPGVGDRTVLNARYEKNGQVTTGVVRIELVQEDVQNHAFLRRRTTTWANNPPRIKESWVPANELTTRESATAELNKCGAPDILEAIEYNQEAIMACKKPLRSADANGFIWGGVALDLVVKADLTFADGGHLTYTPTEISWH